MNIKLQSNGKNKSTICNQFYFKNSVLEKFIRNTIITINDNLLCNFALLIE